ncbi:MAG: hypothetical protein M5U01_15940 [Ardenticatenaceae bacterium]|nr:hypothetical protein [Ardenticatenaceae bacterium]
MPDRRPGADIEANFRHAGLCNQDINPINGSQINDYHVIPLRAEVKAGRILASSLAVGRLETRLRGMGLGFEAGRELLGAFIIDSGLLGADIVQL